MTAVSHAADYSASVAPVAQSPQLSLGTQPTGVATEGPAREVAASLDLNETLRDLAMVSGLMEEESEEEEEKEEKEEKSQATLQEEFRSLREAYAPRRTSEFTEEVMTLPPREETPAAEEMLGVRKIDRKSNVRLGRNGEA